MGKVRGLQAPVFFTCSGCNLVSVGSLDYENPCTVSVSVNALRLGHLQGAANRRGADGRDFD